MPSPRSAPRRRKGAAAGGGVSSLDSEKSHTPGLQEALALTSHLMQRPSLRDMVARILEDSYLNVQMAAAAADGAPALAADLEQAEEGAEEGGNEDAGTAAAAEEAVAGAEAPADAEAGAPVDMHMAAS